MKKDYHFVVYLDMFFKYCTMLSFSIVLYNGYIDAVPMLQM